MHPHIIDNKLAKECAAGCVLDPFTYRAFMNLRCSGVGVVPKKENKWRMIMHLSAPEGYSINDFISSKDFSFATPQWLGYSLISEWVAKVDLKAAFRMIPVRKQDWELLGIQWCGKFYVDTCLPFGLRSAPFLFNEFADTLEWIL